VSGELQEVRIELGNSFQMQKVIQHSWAKDGNEISIAPNSLDLIFNDPPYNIGKKYKDDPTHDRLADDVYFNWVKFTIHEQTRILRPGGTLWWLCPDAHSDIVGPLLTSLVGPRLYRIVKRETFSQYQQKTLTQDYRLLFCHQKPGGPLTFNPDAIRVPSDRQIKYKDKRADGRGRVPGQTWKFEDSAMQKLIDSLPPELAAQVVAALPKDQVPGQTWKIRRLQGTSDDHVDWHECQLPPELLQRVIKGWSKEGDTLMDGFAGSGNFGLACKLLNRNAYLVDQSASYCKDIEERLAA
jgi:16S rRNA G966 N2-methylase RsmD